MNETTFNQDHKNVMAMAIAGWEYLLRITESHGGLYRPQLTQREVVDIAIASWHKHNERVAKLPEIMRKDAHLTHTNMEFAIHRLNKERMDAHKARMDAFNAQSAKEAEERRT